jgi:hypothetical protein
MKVSAYKRYFKLAGLWLTLVFIYVLAQGQAAKQVSDSAKPAISISFERQTIRENDCIVVNIWFANEGNHDLNEVDLYIAAPDFMIWRTDSCDGLAVVQPLRFGPARANSVYVHKLCATTKPDITVGTFNIAFTFKYSWETDGVIRQSFVSSEKPLNASLFGSDNVAGIPLNLAGFVVPGLFFWLVLSNLKVPGSVELALGDKLIYSVALSVGIVGFVQWLNLMDTGSGIGFRKLARLAVIGISLGLVVSGSYYVGRAVRRLRIKARSIDPNDALDVLLEKMLRQNLRAPRTYRLLQKLLRKNSHRPAIVRILKGLLRLIPRYGNHNATLQLKEGTTFIGSLSATSDGVTLLAGWFQINIHGQSEDVKRRFREYEEDNSLVDMIRLARTEHLEIETHQLIQVRKSGGLSNAGESILLWEKSKVSRVLREEDAVAGPAVVIIEQQ